MPTPVTEARPCKLSICIATFNRQEALHSTLQRLVAQIESSNCQDQCEIVVCDNSSSDNTEQVASAIKQRFPRLRYVRHEVNIGWERNFNSAVQAAQGEYCWLMPDDDALKPGALTAVLNALQRDPCLVVVNAEHVDADDNSIVLLRRRLDFSADRTYGPDEMDHCFEEVGWHLAYVGAVVIRRSIWLERIKEEYYGSWFPQVGVILQAPLPGNVIALADVLIGVSVGRQFWMSSAAEIFSYRWPLLVQSLDLSDAVKTKVARRGVRLKLLVQLRANGLYSLTDYRRWVLPQLRLRRERLARFCVAAAPGKLINALCVLYAVSRYYLSGSDEIQRGNLRWLSKSPYYFGRR